MLSGSRFNSSVCPFYKLFYQSFLFLNQFPLLLSKFSLIHFSNLSLYQILPIILHFPKSLKFFFVFLPPSVSKFFTLLLIWTLHRVLIVHFRYRLNKPKWILYWKDWFYLKILDRKCLELIKNTVEYWYIHQFFPSCKLFELIFLFSNDKSTYSLGPPEGEFLSQEFIVFWQNG